MTSVSASTALKNGPQKQSFLYFFKYDKYLNFLFVLIFFSGFLLILFP